MFRLSKIALRLSLYFGSLLIIFALVVGVGFYQQMKTHTIDLRKQEMIDTARRMAEVISDNIDVLEFYHGHSVANSRLATYLDNVAQEDVWLVDRSRNLFMNSKHARLLAKKNEIFDSSREMYNYLPSYVRDKIEEGFRFAKEFLIQDYSRRYKGTAVTAGAPVIDRQGTVRAVVVLHAPISGLQTAADNGLKILVFCIVIALGLGLILSATMANLFTRPLAQMQLIAEELGKENYGARCNIVQTDEIGSLAGTLDTLAERLEIAQEQRQQLENMRKRFVANITHELRTPLTVVLANLEALRMGVITGKSELDKAYANMYKEGLFAKDMITDLLELSKLQNVDFPLDMSVVNFIDILRDAVNAGEKLAIEKNVSILLQCDTEMLKLNGDQRRLRQMILIFITNAIKFSGERQSIEIILKNGNLTITDHGCGMSTEAVEHAFESFYKSHDERNKEGSGLGLAIARSIADRHGLVLTLTSAEGIGTTVRLVLGRGV